MKYVPHIFIFRPPDRTLFGRFFLKKSTLTFQFPWLISMQFSMENNPMVSVHLHK